MLLRETGQADQLVESIQDLFQGIVSIDDYDVVLRQAANVVHDGCLLRNTLTEEEDKELVDCLSPLFGSIQDLSSALLSTQEMETVYDMCAGVLSVALETFTKPFIETQKSLSGAEVTKGRHQEVVKDQREAKTLLASCTIEGCSLEAVRILEKITPFCPKHSSENALLWVFCSARTGDKYDISFCNRWAKVYGQNQSQSVRFCGMHGGKDFLGGEEVS